MPRRLSGTATSTSGMFGIPTHCGYSSSRGGISVLSRTPYASLCGGRSAQTRADLIPRVLTQMDNLCSPSQTNVGLLRFPFLVETMTTRPFSHHFPPPLCVLDIFLLQGNSLSSKPLFPPLPPTPTPTQITFPQKADTLLPNPLSSWILLSSSSSRPLVLQSTHLSPFKTNICRFLSTSPLQSLPSSVRHIA